MKVFVGLNGLREKAGQKYDFCVSGVVVFGLLNGNNFPPNYLLDSNSSNLRALELRYEEMKIMHYLSCNRKTQKLLCVKFFVARF